MVTYFECPLNVDTTVTHSRVIGFQISTDQSLLHLASSEPSRRLTVWKEEQFTVLPFQGIEQRKKRVSEWVAKTLSSVKPGVWGCVQTRTQWSTEEDAHMRPDHHWHCEFGDAGNGTSCERQFNLGHHQCEDYCGTRFYNKDSALVIKR